MTPSLPSTCIPHVFHPSPLTPRTPVQVVREAYPDLTAQDKSSKYHDPKATPEDPRWSMVDFKLVSGSLQLLLS
jgi:predicted RNA-binding protein with PUA-like domain